METVAIFGVGLIGGSFALALKKSGFEGRIVGVSSPSSIARARARGAIDGDAAAEDAARAADLIYLAQPISAILETLPRLRAWIGPEALVTDAGSTKRAIVEGAAEAGLGAQFLGGHPLAGKERRGVQHAEADLFRGRTYVLTPRDEADLQRPAPARFVALLRSMGAQILVDSPQRHDEIVAYTSHLPQLASTALAACLSRKFDGRVPPIWGPALVDSTRLALSDFEIWGDILETNRDAIAAAIEIYIAQVRQMQEMLVGGGMKRTFHEAAELARRVRASG